MLLQFTKFFIFFIILALQINYYRIWCLRFKKNIVIDIINHRKIVNSGGLILIINFLFFLSILFILDEKYFEIVNDYFPRHFILYLNIFILTIISFKDDLKSIDPRIRLSVQIFVAYLSLTLIQFPLTTFLPQKIENIIAIITIVFIINTTNFYDGLDGMLSIKILSISSSILIISYFEQTVLVSSILSVGLVTLFIAFLPFNFPKAKIFLGDSGSVTFGFILSIIFFELIVKEYYLYAFVIFFVPFLDVTITILKKIIKKIPIWKRLFDYYFLMPVIKFKKTHIYSTIPYAIYCLIQNILLYIGFKQNVEQINFLSIFFGLAYLFYCSNVFLFLKK